MPFIKRQLFAESPALRNRPIVLGAEENAEMRRFVAEALSGQYRVVRGSDPLDVVFVNQPAFDRLAAELRACERLTQVTVLGASAKADVVSQPNSREKSPCRSF